ncbi:hypothetical protein [Swingsia samuiensis]|nr:hypothetical protein [Swingsia samuiensis]
MLGIFNNSKAAAISHENTKKNIVNKSDGTISVTSESMDYCQKLVKNVDKYLIQPHEIPVGAMEDALRLRQEGEKFCQHHRIRGGIARLRRALVLIRSSQEHK